MFTRQDLRTLVTAEAQPCVSIFMPTHRVGREIRQDPIRLRNLLRQAEEQLRARGTDNGDARAILRGPSELLNGVSLESWHYNSDGLALFAHKDFFHYYRVPLNLEELVIINARFHVKPLLELLQSDGRFYVLAVSPKRVRLMEGSKHQLVELQVDALPESLAGALNIDEFVSAPNLHSHTTIGVGNTVAGRREAIFHGHGAGTDADRKQEVLEYFQRLDDVLTDFFHEERSPLVYAGVEEWFAIFREASHYPGLIDKPLKGNADIAEPRELHGPAWKLVEPKFDVDRQKAVDRYGTLASRNQASDELATVLTAARTGRVDTLMLTRDAHLWGTVDEESGNVYQSDQQAPESDDLLDYAAVHTILNSGAVYVMDREAMPSDQVLAATFRY